MRAAPAMPPPAPTFSTTTGCPRISARRDAMMRPNTSPGPPAPNGTTMVTGRIGQVCAAAGVHDAISAAAAASVLMLGTGLLAVLIDSRLNGDRDGEIML